MTSEQGRRRQLAAVVEGYQCTNVYDEQAREALITGEVPHYALVTSEGTVESAYASNPNLTVHDSLDALGETLAAEADEGWAPRGAVDLDTGEDVPWALYATMGNRSGVAVLVEIQEACGYSDGEDGKESGVDSLIDYKNALEDRLARLIGNGKD